MTISAQDLEERLALALDHVAREPARAPDRHVDLGKEARVLPTETVDQATAGALRKLLADRTPSDPLRSTIFIAAEQFAHEAGADRFGPRTRKEIALLLKERPDFSSLTDNIEAAHARAHLHELRRAVGVGTSLRELETDTGMKEFAPGLWLDLAQRELSSDAYLRKFDAFLTSRSILPTEILPRLKSMVRIHGATTAQLALNLSCRFLHQFGRYDEARDLLFRAERLSSLGWTMPCEDEPYKGIVGYQTAEEIIEDFRQAIHDASTPKLVLQRYRIMLIPFFSSDTGTLSTNLTSNFLEVALNHISQSELWVLVTDAKYLIKDQNGRDWFASVAISRLPKPVPPTASVADPPFKSPARKPKFVGGVGKLLIGAGFAA